MDLLASDLRAEAREQYDILHRYLVGSIHSELVVRSRSSDIEKNRRYDWHSQDGEREGGPTDRGAIPTSSN